MDDHLRPDSSELRWARTTARELLTGIFDLKFSADPHGEAADLVNGLELAKRSELELFALVMTLSSVGSGLADVYVTTWNEHRDTEETNELTLGGALDAVFEVLDADQN